MSSLNKPKLIVILLAAGLFSLGAWSMLSAYQPAGARECLRRYKAARTAADTALVDASFPDSAGHPTPESHSCRFMRQNARWWADGSH